MVCRTRVSNFPQCSKNIDDLDRFPGPDVHGPGRWELIFPTGRAGKWGVIFHTGRAGNWDVMFPTGRVGKKEMSFLIAETDYKKKEHE